MPSIYELIYGPDGGPSGPADGGVDDSAAASPAGADDSTSTARGENKVSSSSLPTAATAAATTANANIGESNSARSTRKQQGRKRSRRSTAGTSSTDTKNHPDGEYAYDPIESFYDAPGTTPAAAGAASPRRPNRQARSVRSAATDRSSILVGADRAEGRGGRSGAAAGRGQSIQTRNPILATSLLTEQNQMHQQKQKQQQLDHSDYFSSTTDDDGGGGGNASSASSAFIDFSSSSDDDNDDDDFIDGAIRRRKRKRRRSSLLSSSSLTPQQVQRKRERKARSNKRRRFRYHKRWDLSNEVDWGGAVETMMRRLMEDGKGKATKKSKGKAGSKKMKKNADGGGKEEEKKKAKTGSNGQDEKEQEVEVEIEASSSDHDGSGSGSDGSSDHEQEENGGGVLDSLLRLSQDAASAGSTDFDASDATDGGGYQSQSQSEGEQGDGDDRNGPMSYLKQGYSYPVTGLGHTDTLEYSYTRDSTYSTAGQKGSYGVNRSQLRLHGKNSSVVRAKGGSRDLEPFFYWPLMARYGHCGGRRGVEDTRAHLSSRGDGDGAGGGQSWSSTYLPPRGEGSTNIRRDSGGRTGNSKRATQVKARPVPTAPRADELYMDQLRRIAACVVSGSTGTEPPAAAAAVLEGGGDSAIAAIAATAAAANNAAKEAPPTTHRETVFRLISLLHSKVNTSDHPNTASYSRDKAVLQYAREVESNRELWSKLRYGIRTRLRQLQKKNSRDNGSESGINELRAFSDNVVDAMDELLGDEPCWMCGPNATWESEGIRRRAEIMRKRIEKMFPSSEGGRGEVEDGVGSGVEDDDGNRADDEREEYSNSPRKVRFDTRMKGGSGSDYEPSDDDSNDDSDVGTGTALKPRPESSPPPDAATPLAGAIRHDITVDKDGGDKYAAMIRGSARLDPTTMIVTISALVSELCTARARAQRGRNMSDGKSEEDTGYLPSAITKKSSAEDEMKLAVLDYFDLVLKSFPLYNQHKDIPHPNLAFAALLRQSFVANDISPSSFVAIDDNRSVSGANTDEKECINMSLVAEDIANTGRKFMADPRLKAFPELHITTAIASIAAVLPSNAAEILSRPCCLDDLMHRTPFDLVRYALEDMESRGQITHGNNGAGSALVQEDVISASKLISELTSAADSAGECADKEKDDPLYMSWHLALLAGATCVSSGIIIGKGAQRAASDYYDTRGSAARRTRTENHAEIRLLTANGLRLLLEQCTNTRHQATQHHVAISSFLEWKEATCLVMNRGSNDKENFRRIRELHAHHTIEWAKVDRSTAAISRVEELRSTKEVNADVSLMMLADRLEQDPDDDEKWMSLASALGPLGDVAPTGQEKAILCLIEGCKQCLMLQKNVFVDHGDLSRRRRDRGWWGDGRADWWEPLFFDSSPLIANDLKMISVSICTALDDQMRATAERDSTRLVSNGRTAGIGPRHRLNLEPVWLASSESENDFYFSSDDEDAVPVPADRKGGMGAPQRPVKTYDEFLPKHISDVCSKGIDSYLGCMSQPFEEIFLSSTTTDTRCYVTTCCKVLVACHLFGVHHHFITNSIARLACACAQVTTGGNVATDHGSCQFLSLLWLAKQGLNVQQILQNIVANEGWKGEEVGRRCEPATYAFTPISF